MKFNNIQLLQLGLLSVVLMPVNTNFRLFISLFKTNFCRSLSIYWISDGFCETCVIFNLQRMTSNYRYLLYIARILILNPIQISQPLLNNFKVQILARYRKFSSHESPHFKNPLLPTGLCILRYLNFQIGSSFIL